jgi:hypothetical protein
MLQRPRAFWERWWERRTGTSRYEVIVHPEYTLVVRARTPHEAAVVALREAFARYGRRTPLRAGGYEVLPAARMLRVRSLTAPEQETLWPVEEIAATLGYGRPFGLG